MMVELFHLNDSNQPANMNETNTLQSVCIAAAILVCIFYQLVGCTILTYNIILTMMLTLNSFFLFKYPNL